VTWIDEQKHGIDFIGAEKEKDLWPVEWEQYFSYM